MIDYVINNIDNPLADIKINLGVDKPLWKYIKSAVQEIELINEMALYHIPEYDKDTESFIEENDEYNEPFLHCVNWHWNPHPFSKEIKYRRRETGTKVDTKLISDMRVGILSFDIFFGARDKNKRIESKVIHNELYIPIEDDRGLYLIDNILYSEYQLVDKLLYPSGKNSFTLKSLLPVVIKYEDATATSIDGYIVTSKIGMVKIFTTMEPILSCFMHIPAPLSYLEVFPILQYCGKISDDKDKYEYFKPLDDREIYIKAYKDGIEKFDYVKTILMMSIYIIKKHKPPTIEHMRDSRWWIYILSQYDNTVEHRGACYQMHVSRMLDTISAEVLPMPEIDKRDMISLLRYTLQTQFENINIYSYENKRLRLNEIVSTIVTAEISEKLRRMFKFGRLITIKDMEPSVKFRPDMILKKIHTLGTIHVTDFANDLDYYQFLRYSKKGPNSLGRLDKNKINTLQRQLHPSMIGVIDMMGYSKDVGQSGILSPYMENPIFEETDVNKYPNIKFELFKYIHDEFPNPALTFDCDNIVDYNKILDKLVASTYINLDYHIKPLRDENNEEKK